MVPGQQGLTTFLRKNINIYIKASAIKLGVFKAGSREQRESEKQM